MKKILTIAVAAVMAFSLSMPAFAAATEGQMANEGKLVQQIGNALTEGKTDAAVAAAKEVVSAISTNDSDVSKMTAEHIEAVLVKTEAKQAENTVAVGGANAVVAFVGENNSGSGVTVSSLTATPASETAPLTLTLEASVSGQQSGLGYLVSLDLPASVVNPSASTGTGIKIYHENEIYLTIDGQKLDTVTSVINRGDGSVILTAWVPHFSTYNVVMGQSIQVGQPILPNPDGGNGGNGGDSGSGSNDSGSGSSSTPAATPAPVVAENPIKKTGADMNAALTVLAVLAGAALVGGAVAVKKNGLDQ